MNDTPAGETTLRIGRSTADRDAYYLTEQRNWRWHVLQSTVADDCGLVLSAGSLRAINRIIATLEETVAELQSTLTHSTKGAPHGERSGSISE